MPNRDDILREATFKGDVEGLEERVFHTLFYKAGGKGELPDEIKLHRTQKLVAGLVEKLQDQSILTDDEVDDLLFGVLG